MLWRILFFFFVVNSVNLQKIIRSLLTLSNKGQLLQDPFLNALRKEHVPVSIYLVNGIKLQGNIESFDQYVVLLTEYGHPDGLQARNFDCRACPSGEFPPADSEQS